MEMFRWLPLPSVEMVKYYMLRTDRTSGMKWRKHHLSAGRGNTPTRETLYNMQILHVVCLCVPLFCCCTLPLLCKLARDRRKYWKWNMFFLQFASSPPLGEPSKQHFFQQIFSLTRLSAVHIFKSVMFRGTKMERSTGLNESQTNNFRHSSWPGEN